MSEVDESRRSAISLMTRPGLAEVLLLLRHRHGSATLAQLRDAGVRNPLEPLRILAAGGHVAGCGVSFDDAVPDDAIFTLSHSGTGLADVLVDLQVMGRHMIERRPRTRTGIITRIRAAASRRWAQHVHQAGAPHESGPAEV